MGRLRFRRSAPRNKRNLSVCKCGNPFSLSIIPSPSAHTHRQRQADGAVCRACPIKLHPLVKKIYGCNIHTTNTQIHTHAAVAVSCVHKFQTTHTHTNYLIFIILFIPLPQQMQVAEQSSSTTLSPFGPFLCALFLPFPPLCLCT